MATKKVEEEKTAVEEKEDKKVPKKSSSKSSAKKTTKTAAKKTTKKTTTKTAAKKKATTKKATSASKKASDKKKNDEKDSNAGEQLSIYDLAGSADVNDENKENNKEDSNIVNKNEKTNIEEANDAEGKNTEESEKPKAKVPRRQHKTIASEDSKKTSEEEKSEKDKSETDKLEKDKKDKKKQEPKPSQTPETLQKLTHDELLQKADELKILPDVVDGLKKDELVAVVFKELAAQEGFKRVRGILDIMQDGYGFLRCKDYMPSEIDVYLSVSLIRKNGLRKGDEVIGQTRPPREGEKYAALAKIEKVNGTPIENFKKRPRFADLTPIFPDERLNMEHDPKEITARVIELVAPIGKGQRGLIVSPPKAGKTTILKDIAHAISANNPEVHLMCLLIDERPEEVTDMERSIDGEVISSTFDMPCENHTAIAELTIERAKRLVEDGRDVVVLLDSITRLARAYNLAQPPSGRVLSGGVDSSALYPPKRFLGAARNIENGGSLTILASALIETGSKMDEVIFEEFKGTGNMELKLDRSLADRRIFPAIDPVTSGTRKEDLLLDPQEAPLIWAVRRVLANVNSTERSMDMLIKSIKKTQNNREFLIRTAKKASKGSDNINV